MDYVARIQYMFSIFKESGSQRKVLRLARCSLYGATKIQASHGVYYHVEAGIQPNPKVYAVNIESSSISCFSAI